MATPRIDIPEEGYYFTRHVRGGPRIPARIWRSIATDPVTGETLDRSPLLQAEIGGSPCDPNVIWPRVCGQEITKAEFDYLTAEAEWCAEHAPNDPAANPRRAISPLTTPTLF
ncbi:hypothetical protein A6A04_13285 [Paramagnetospirillum marisnigri]|uniref:Uncharacterized protein n=1 Tax=Paramagnetospirillum marisnigri TaxID=1285242 RepID=A0A178MUB5_9PROT|nr:hypothetical protein [Paramagnetospirillum marisnigri]OAN53860.1 hypothetical protein A6A04_13285 [Paramagnetospirillum marisnigri]